MNEKITNSRGSNYADTLNYISQDIFYNIQNSDRINKEVNIIEVLYAINSAGVNSVTDYSFLFARPQN